MILQKKTLCIIAIDFEMLKTGTVHSENEFMTSTLSVHGISQHTSVKEKNPHQ